MSIITANLQAVKSRIATAAQAAGRSTEDVALLAVSKTFSADCVRSCAAAGQRAFGENYVQEALDKITALQTLDLVWHFIGPIQSNKTRPIAENFHWVHSLDRERIAQRLNDARSPSLSPLNVCMQVNISGEASSDWK